jgi:hypothetical protein
MSEDQMTQRIIYATNDGGLAVIIPANCGLSVSEIARKDVPASTPYLIVDASDIPADRTYREAWMADFSNPDGYGIGQEAWFAEQEANANHSS